MRIAVLIESDGPGGAEAMVLSLAHALRKAGVEVFPVVLGNGQGWLSGRLRDGGFEIHQPVLQRAIDPAFAVSLSRWTRSRNIDLLHAHEFTMGFYGSLAARLARRPFVLTMHGGTKFADKKRRRVALRWAASQAASLIAVSESTRLHLASALGLSVGKIQVIPNGVEFVNGNRELGLKSLAVKDDQIVILAVGNLYPVKGHDVLIEAAGLLLESLRPLPRWQIAIAGRGEQKELLESLIDLRQLRKHVHLLGLRDDIPDLLAAADLFVMPSRSEGMPLALLEAMQAGVPTIVSAVGGVPDIVVDGSSGWLVPPDDPARLAEVLELVLLERDKGGWPGVARLAKQRVEAAFGLESMVQRYVDVYRMAIRGQSADMTG